MWILNPLLRVLFGKFCSHAPSKFLLGLISNFFCYFTANNPKNKFLLGSSKHFISYASCASNEKIWIVDGFLAPIAGKGQIVPFDDLALQNI